MKDPFNLIKIFLLNKIKYPCLKKEETKMKFTLILGTNNQSYKTNVLFKEKNYSTIPIDTTATLTFKFRCNVNSPSFSFLIF